MLRKRLSLSFVTIVVVLWVVTLVALMMMRNSTKGYGKLLRNEFVYIDAAQSIRTLTVTLNSRYLPTLASNSPLGADRQHYDNVSKELQAKLDMIKARADQDVHWEEAVSRLEDSMKTYFEGFERHFADAPPSGSTLEDREQLLSFISTQTRHLTDASNAVMLVAEERLYSGVARLQKMSGKNSLILAITSLLGTSIACLVCLRLHKHMVDPVEHLHHSIGEAKEGNYELSIPSTPGDPVYSSVASAFNELAAELKAKRGENEESLIRSSNVNRAILEAIPSPVFVLSDNRDVVEMNPAAELLTENLGVSGRMPLKLQRILDECRQEGSEFLPQDPRDAILFRIREEEFFYLPRIFHFGAPGSPQSGWAVMLHNVSRIRWLDDMKTNLLASVSHEIKTPLTGIRMVLHLLLEERSSKLDDKQRMLVSSASGDCERLLTSLNALLELSRAESGSPHLSRVPIDLRSCVEKVCKQIAPVAAEEGVSLQMADDDEKHPEVLADPVRLEEVLNNLLSNAIQHSPGNGVVKIRLSKSDSEFIRVSVIDQGPGVPEAAQSRIFERFFRAPGQEARGLGLGLFISREIMRAHEGRIGLLERNGDETEFYVDVPIA